MKQTTTIRTLWGLFLILVLTFVVYLPSFHYDFTNWDDDIHVTNNSLVQHLNAASVTDLFRPSAKYMYHPLTMLTYALDWAIGGGSAENFHSTSIILHLLNVILVFFLLRRIIASETVALFCTAVFALHPLQVESVAWISARKEVLYSFFYLISLFLYIVWDEKKNLRYYLLSLAFFVCSLLSKPTAVTLPLVILAAEWLRSGKLTLKTIAKLAPFLAGAAVFTFINEAAQVQYTIAPVRFYSLPQRALLIAYQLVFYPAKVAVPKMLSACYAYPALAYGALPREFYLAPLYLAIGIIILWLIGRKSSGVFYGPVIYLVTLSPVLQVIPFNNASLVADRYVYLPIIGLAFLFSQLVELSAEEISKHRVKTSDLKNAFYGIIVLLLLVPSIQRIPVWMNSLTLFNDVIQKNNQIGIAYGNRSDARLKEGDFAGALDDCMHLAALRPDDGHTYYNKGNALFGLHRYTAAVGDFTRSIDLGFAKSSVFYNRGLAYHKLGAIDSALADFHSSRSLDPESPDPPYSLGYVALHSQSDARLAVAYFDSALTINPKNAEALYQKSFAEYQLRSYGKAMEDLSVAISNHPELRGDPLLGEIDRSIDSVNAAVSALRKQGGKSHSAIEDRIRLHALYLILGDSLRAEAIDGSIRATNENGAHR